jgi:hypothetical protein
LLVIFEGEGPRVLESIWTAWEGFLVFIWICRLGKRGLVFAREIVLDLEFLLIEIARRRSGAIAIGRTEKLE